MPNHEEHQRLHSHEHGHAHGGAGHAHAPRDFGRAFAIGVALNLAFVGVEAVFGLAADSLALLSDAGHNLSDVLGLLLAWAASALAKSSPTTRRTFGFRSTTILAALFNALLLLAVTGGIAWEAIGRLVKPVSVQSNTMIWVAAVGVFINAATAWMFLSGRKEDLNIRGAFLHLAGDALISVGVVVAGILIASTHQLWLDPVVSLLIGLAIVAGTWGLLRESVNLLLHAVPAGVDVAEVRAYLEALPSVREVHDLHIWAMSTSEIALTAHLVRSGDRVENALLERACHELRERFGIGHTTLQIEADDGHCCDLASDEVV
ncbi:MAG: cation diffusion facilitator family transporter [Chthoniobacteraceae bacterium]|nr:cation diffusion facilitator family transporter [Chthoniobacteraceae bacterium]